MRISVASELEIKKHIKDRHYYLRQARTSIILKDASQMHVYCEMAEVAQKKIDEFIKLYPNYELSQCMKPAISR